MDLYDKVADGYDDTWKRTRDLVENEMIVGLVRAIFGEEPRSVIDVGCGTGQALDLGIANLDRDTYYGFDPSLGMLNTLREKYPSADVMKATTEEFLRASDMRADLVLVMFAVPSYMTPEEMDGIAERARRAAIFMPYDMTNLPAYYGPGGLEDPPLEQFNTARDHVLSMAARPGNELFKIGDFDTAVVLR